MNLFLLLTGRLPFPVEPHSNLSQLHAAILRGTTFPSHLSQSEFCVSNAKSIGKCFKNEKHITWKQIHKLHKFVNSLGRQVLVLDSNRINTISVAIFPILKCTGQRL